MEHRIRLRVNGQVYEVGVETEVTLLDLVREKLDLTGTKAGCRVGECGTCTVLMDGQPVNSCLILAVEADGCEVMTVEGLSREWSVRTGGRSPSQSIPLVRAVRQRPAETVDEDSLATSEVLHPLQRAFVTCGAIQCGFCTPGMLMSAKALLDENPSPTFPEIRRALRGNLCRCTGYKKIEQAIMQAARVLKREKGWSNHRGRR